MYLYDLLGEVNNSVLFVDLLDEIYLWLLA